jgi:hypothetical protein
LTTGKDTIYKKKGMQVIPVSGFDEYNSAALTLNL